MSEPTKNYLVLSLEFIGNCPVKVHCLTHSLQTAEHVYKCIAVRNRVAQILEINDEFMNKAGQSLFWKEGHFTL